MSGENLLIHPQNLYLHEVQLTEVEGGLGKVREGSLFCLDAAAATAALASAA